jgi:CheY-like chemotaxis protein
LLPSRKEQNWPLWDIKRFECPQFPHRIFRGWLFLVIRVLVVDDYEPFRRFISLTLQSQKDLWIVSEAADGIEAVARAKELQPELILLDIGLPKMNGIQAAQGIRSGSPNSKILFVSQEASADIVQECFNTGAHGFVVKTDAGRELLTAVGAVLRGEYFVGTRFAGHDFTGALHAGRTDKSVPASDYHEVTFCSDDDHLVDHIAAFVSAALKAGDAAVIFATESHQDGLLSRLRVSGLNMAVLIKQGRYIALDAAETLSAIMVNDMPDADRFVEAFGNLIRQHQMPRKASSTGLRSLANVYICCGHKAILKRQFRWNDSVTSSRRCTP